MGSQSLKRDIDVSPEREMFRINPQGVIKQ